MCGASGSEKQLAGQSSALSGTLGADFNERFADQSDTIKLLNQDSANLKAGNIPQGFNASTLAALNTGAVDTSAAETNNARRAVQGAYAGRGGDSGLMNPAEAGVLGSVTAAGAGKTADELQKIQLANNAAGRQDLEQAIGTEAGIAKLQDPEGFGKAATDANQTAYGEAQSNAMATSQEFADIAGGVAGIAKAGAGFIPGFSSASGSAGPASAYAASQYGSSTAFQDAYDNMGAAPLSSELAGEQ